MKKTVVFIFFLLVIAIGLGVTRYVVLPKYYPHLLKSSISAQPSPAVLPEQIAKTDIPVDAPVTSATAAALVQKLSPRQKIAQLLAVPSQISDKSTVTSAVISPPSLMSEVPGAFILFGKNISALQAQERVISLRRTPALPEIIKTLPELSPDEKKLLQPLIVVDHEGGSVQRLRGQGFTTIPSAADQCLMSADVLQPLIDRAAKELASSDIDVVFGPEIDVGEKNPALRTRVCSSDAAKVQEFGARWVLALQKNNLIPVLKHYPGIGQTTVDLHQKAEAIEFDPVQHSIFVALLRKYPGVGVMTTHVILKNSGAELKPCTVSADCLQRLQVDKQTIIFTDGIEMAGVQGIVATRSAQIKQTLADVAFQAITAGHTMIVFGQSTPPEEVDKVITRLADEYQRSPEFKIRVDQAVAIVLSAKANHWSAKR